MKLKFIVLFLSMLHVIITTFAQEPQALLNAYKTTYPNDGVIIKNLQTNTSFEFNEDKQTLEVTEQQTFQLQALKPNEKVQLSFFYSNNSRIARADLNTGFFEKVCGNYNPEGIFHSDLKLCIYSFDLKNPGDENTFTITRKYSDVHYYVKIQFAAKKYPVIYSSIILNVPDNFLIDFADFNTGSYAFEKLSKKDKNETVYQFTCKNIPSFADNEHTPPPSFYLPQLLVIPKKYNYENKQVSFFSDLNDYYKWCKDKADKTFNDVEAIKPIVQELTAGKTSEAEKIRALFYWVQDNIRYIAFEEGLAGYIPDNAQNVFEKKYGDCKGMANLLKTMLIIAGFDARLTWLNTNDDCFNFSIPTLASSNHVICTLFFKNQAFFLDATNKNIPFGYNSEFVCGRQVLIENNTDFILDTIPRSASVNNQVLYNGNFEIKDQGLKGNIHVSFDGDFRASLLSKIKYSSETDGPQLLEEIVSRKMPKILAKNVTATNVNNRDTSLILSGEIFIKDQVVTFDKELYVLPEPFEDINLLFAKNDQKVPLFFSQREKRKSICKIKVPEGYSVTKLPEKFSFSNNYISISLDYSMKDNTVYFTKEWTLTSNLVPTGSIQNWNIDLKKIKKAINQPFIFTKS